MGVRIRRWHVLAGVAAAAVLVAGAVFVWPDGPDDPPPAAKPARPKPTLKPLRLASSPLWTTEGLSLGSGPTGVDRIGETMVIHKTDLGITTVDMSTGTVRHTFGVWDDLTGAGGSWYEGLDDALTNSSGLITTWGHLSDCDDGGTCSRSEGGLALLSATDGRTGWAATVIPSHPRADPDTRQDLHLDVVTDDVALVSVVGGDADEYDDDEDRPPPLRTLAIDARTGATLWETQEPMRPSAVVGDTVVGTVPGTDSTKWTVAGVDLRTGRRTWTSDLTESVVEQVAGDVALLRGSAGKAPWPESFVFVDVATGRTITELDHPENFMEFEAPEDSTKDPETVTSCGDDGRTLIFCVGKDARSDDGVVAIFRVDKRTVTTEAVDYPDLRARGPWSSLARAWSGRVRGAWSGRAVLYGGPEGDPYRHVFTMDSAGNVIDKDLRPPGTINELTADRAIFFDLMGPNAGVEVYEVLS